ncbi:WD40-repeat-containing domain protein [Neurospora hispaniola]|uniref:WD40-repeat-containing domain protein n=1 Tax=Neurospora hispaniola TaxID=588809 RepID=A0AAJ0IG30_9PEZI|nr:WD40-repeat-containing domain protein [Neurospora hispaniola]
MDVYDNNTFNGKDDFPRKILSQLLGSHGPVHAVTYSASPGTYILTGSADRSIRLYNPIPASPSSSTATTTTSSTSFITKPSQPPSTTPPQGRLIQTYTSHGYEVLSLSVSSSNATFASSGGDRAVFLWDVSTATTIRRFSNQGHTTGRINSVIFAGVDDSLLISGGHDTTVRIWDVRSQSSSRPVQVLREAKDGITSLAVSPGGAEVLAGSVDGRVRTYDVRMGRLVTDVFPGAVTSLCLARDGKTVLVGSLDSKIRLMDRSNGQCLRTYGGDGNANGDAAGGWTNKEIRVQSVLGGGERWVVAGDENGAENSNGEGRVWAWDLLTGKLVAKLGVPWGPGGGKVVVGRDGKEKERKNVVSCVAWKDGGFGNQFCVGGTSGVVTVYGEA